MSERYIAHPWMVVCPMALGLPILDGVVFRMGRMFRIGRMFRMGRMIADWYRMERNGMQTEEEQEASASE